MNHRTGSQRVVDGNPACKAALPAMPLFAPALCLPPAGLGLATVIGTASVLLQTAALIRGSTRNLRAAMQGAFNAPYTFFQVWGGAQRQECRCMLALHAAQPAPTQPPPRARRPTLRAESCPAWRTISAAWTSS